MAVWERASFATADGVNAQVNIDTNGDLWVRILSPSFRTAGTPDHTFVGHGCQLITSEPQS